MHFGTERRAIEKSDCNWSQSLFTSGDRLSIKNAGSGGGNRLAINKRFRHFPDRAIIARKEVLNRNERTLLKAGFWSIRLQLFGGASRLLELQVLMCSLLFL